MLVKHYAGSHAYGTALPTSDTDFRGIFCADPVNLLTPFFKIQESSDTTEEDTKLYELSHFIKLCTDCNPNIVETMWVDDDDITFRTPAYDLLREHRELMLSSKIAFTTSGYALAQLKRIKGHNKWITNPQSEEPPRQTDFLKLVQNFTPDREFKFDVEKYRDNHRFIPYGGDIYGVVKWTGYELYDDKFTLNTTFEGEHHEAGVPMFIVKFVKEEYKRAKETHQQYWTWKKNRNEVRSELEEQFGYDTKHAMHLVRLLRMGKEALTEGKIIVKRPDADELLSIRGGAWTYEEIVQYAEEMDREVREVLYKQTDLPKKSDIKKIAKLLMEVQELVWSK